MKVIVSVILALALMFNSGCASYMVYKSSQDGIKARGEANPTFLQTISEKPALQGGALLVDGLTLWGAYEGVKAIDGDNSGSSDNTTRNTKTTTANNNTSGENTTIVQGDGNTVTINTGDTLPPEAAPEAQPVEGGNE